MPRYSIILPVRNGGDYFRECVHNVLHQTLNDFTLVVLENASNDGTLEWVSSLQDNRITIYPVQRPLSIEQNWARILSVQKNEFMTLIGYDDLLHADYLQKIDALIRKHPNASLYHTHFKYIDGKGQFVRSSLPMPEIQYAHEFLGCQMNRTIDSTGTGYVMRSKDFDSLGGIPVHYPNLIFSDFELWIKLMLRGYKATALEESFSYRLHESVSRTTNGMLYQQAFGYYIDLLLALMQENTSISEVVTRYGKEFLLYYCESLSHRLLKTSRKHRKLTVAEFLRKCEMYAHEMIPGQEFRPMDRFRIRIAKRLDNPLGRLVFNVYKKMRS